ncbi:MULTISPECIES: hypothetical protein [Mycolicibacterium]|uniref:Uncharacterized protein n=1 Tax=Mycolicibacterium mageritense TaxID=53462 RepID=A0AAI8TUE2_MYCME|nr:hypothetical protein [Mycolicibacterium mageritense]BDY28727.1 hypothetical protein hbim_02662 [Mycolicibacterium mageritense]CDO22855.1 hypothetical protein BN978_03331 [Mycolicibacterium mageritense DSM 44476 = CIP 104973]
MWVIELNVAGHRFTHRVRTPHSHVLPISPRSLLRRPSQLLERVA